MKRTLSLIIALILVVSFVIIVPAQAEPVDLVYQIPIQGKVNPGMLSLVEKGIKEAETAEADAIVFRIDTYGGLVDSGIKIRDEILATEIPTITYVSNRAWSAGALIALAGKDLVMVPGSSMGAAETRPKEEKYISALRKEFKATAEIRDKNPNLAAAMVDADIEIPDMIAKDKLLTLTAHEALELEMTDLIATDFKQLLVELDLEEAKLIQIEATTAERLARWATNPQVGVVLLTLGFLGLVFEALAPGWGVGGTVGLLSLGTFFSSYIINGVASWGLMVLFIIGFFLLALEIFVVPGFGITGIGGLIAILISIFFLFPTPSIALNVLAAVLILSIIGTIIMIKIFGTSRLWEKISLNERQTKGAGYIASQERRQFLNKEGKSITPLRPAGIIELEGRRIDALSEGGFISKDQPVQVVKVEGRKIIVKAIN